MSDCATLVFYGARVTKVTNEFMRILITYGLEKCEIDLTPSSSLSTNNDQFSPLRLGRSCSSPPPLPPRNKPFLRSASSPPNRPLPAIPSQANWYTLRREEKLSFFMFFSAGGLGTVLFVLKIAQKFRGLIDIYFSFENIPSVLFPPAVRCVCVIHRELTIMYWYSAFHFKN